MDNTAEEIAIIKDRLLDPKYEGRYLNLTAISRPTSERVFVGKKHASTNSKFPYRDDVLRIVADGKKPNNADLFAYVQKTLHSDFAFMAKLIAFNQYDPLFELPHPLPTVVREIESFPQLGRNIKEMEKLAMVIGTIERATEARGGISTTQQIRHVECFCCCIPIDLKVAIKRGSGYAIPYEHGHILAHSVGGPNVATNIRMLCPACNKAMYKMNCYEYIVAYGMPGLEKLRREQPDLVDFCRFTVMWSKNTWKYLEYLKDKYHEQIPSVRLWKRLFDCMFAPPDQRLTFSYALSNWA